MSDEASVLLQRFFRAVQRHKKVRMGIGIAILAGLLGIGLSFLYDAMPHNYQLTVTGGDMLSSRHFVARVLQREATENGVALRIEPMSGSREALAAVNAGKLDMAFIQDGLEADYPNVRHVAYVASEPLQLLVRPGIDSIDDLRSKLVNLGLRQGGTRTVAKQVLQFSGLNDGIDYVESNFSTEDLLRMGPETLPDAVMDISFAPADIADFLVKERGYGLLEIPFPDSLALRYGWVAGSKVLAYTYSVTPAVPAEDITTIGIDMYLVANKDIEPRAVFRVLESLYSYGFATRANLKLDETELQIPSGYELSEGAQLFLDRNNPLLTADTWDQAQAMFGLFLSVLSGVLIAYRWFRGESSDEPSPDDPAYIAWISEVTAIEQQFEAAYAAGATNPIGADFLETLQTRLSLIRTESLGKLAEAKLENSLLPQALLLAITDARARISNAALIARRADPPRA